MLRPDELRLLANTWRNIEQAAMAQVDYMRGAGLTGFACYSADAAVLHARTCARQLEERADNLEKTLQHERGGGS